MTTTSFKVLKLDCHSCAMVMEGICEDTPGVTKAEVNTGKRLLTIEHDDSVKPEQLKQALDKEGYP
ncbi:MAG: heavy metal-associated domain-containing protein, partial [Patescibacteria group bacterium]